LTTFAKVSDSPNSFIVSAKVTLFHRACLFFVALPLFLLMDNQKTNDGSKKEEKLKPKSWAKSMEDEDQKKN